MGSRREIWPVVHAERRRLVDALENVDEDAWTTPSLCPGWDVHDVLAHLTDGARTTRAAFVWRMMRSRFDFDADNDRGIVSAKASDPRETLARLARSAQLRRTPPAAPATRLVEVFVHGEDIRRPLGIDADLPVEHVMTALVHQTHTRVAWGGGRERVDGLHLVVTDAEMLYGEGPTVRGRAIDLLLAVSGRPVADGALTGPGAARLRTHAVAH